MPHDRFQLWYARDEPPVEARELRAGPLTALLEGIDLRYVRAGGTELVRRIYVAVRDRNWNTLQPEVSDLQVDARDDSFSVGFGARHNEGDVDFSWRGEIGGTADGAVVYTMDGEAARGFRYNRIGICVLHPPRECAGRPYRARASGAERDGRLPDAIGAQRIEDGKYYPLFPSYEELEIGLDGGLTVRFAFEGDLFEMEDQRNWTDASFKTYSTPITLGFPHDVQAAERIRQRVAVAVAGALPAPAPPRDAVAVGLGDRSGRSLPRLGVGLAAAADVADGDEDLLGALRLDHVRADVRAGSALDAAAAGARRLGAGLELALFLGDDPEAELDRVAEAIGRLAPRVERVLVFREREPTAGGRWARLARERLGLEVPFVAGTNVYFVDLNRDRPDLEGADAVVFSVNPQVHAVDERSIVETAAAQADAVRSAAALSAGLPVVVSPVTLRPRFDANATEPEPPPEPDPRQRSLFAAAWTLASAKQLAESGASSVTYYESTGPGGLVESGRAFPVYHVLADLAELRGREIVSAESSDPLAVEALALTGGAELSVLVANLTSSPQRVSLHVPGPGGGAIRTLDEESAGRASTAPVEFRGETMPLEVVDGTAVVELAPFAVARVDLVRVNLDPDSIRALAPARLYALDGKVAIVTGAAGGAGRWLAAGLGAAGASVVLTDRGGEALDDAVALLAGAGLSAAALPVDLAEPGAPARVVDGARDRFGSVDVLVNCAVVNRRRPILEVDEETYDFVMDVDLRAPYFLAQAAARAMIDAGDGGAIVNIASVNAFYGLEHVSVYGAAKAGLAQVTRVMALEWVEHAIRVNCIAPGFLDTPLSAPLWADPERRRWLLNRTPVRRPGRPDELVGTCLLLASEAGSFITGQTFCVDGGFLAGGRWFTPDV